MNEFIINFFLGFFSASLMGFLLFWLYFVKREKESRALREAYYKIQLESVKLKEKLSAFNNTKEQFQQLTDMMLEQNRKRLIFENQTHLSQILQPFKDNINDFNKKIESYYHDESKERYSLIKEIQRLQILNQKISDEANNLANALKGDNRVQGEWGEYILQRVLESSGLKEGREYEIQKEFLDQNKNRQRPDIIIHLPDKKDIIIDSKLSLVAYERFYSCDDANKRDLYLKNHIDSIRIHIKELSSKKYQNIPNINTLDFVLMFIPIEAAFLLAIEKDKRLYESAYSQNIILVSPSTLLAVLRTIENSWRYEYQNKNARLIAKKAGDMHDKFVAFVDEMLLVEKSLNRAKQSYDDAFKKLSSGKGNLISRAKQLKELDGVYHKKEQNSDLLG